MKRGDVTYRRRKPLRPRGRPAVSLAGLLAVAALVSGCGIRTTSVPVDAGAAPSRVPRSGPPRTSPRGRRTVWAPRCIWSAPRSWSPWSVRCRADAVGAEPVKVARALLKEVQQAPSASERRAGFTTAVPAGLRVDPSRDGDPAGTLRLSSQPEDLSAEALAQLVCTYAESDALVRDGSVVLGGPGDYPPRGYLCTSQTKSRPGDLTTPDALRLD
ncbi:lipoprotein [Streptomyces badius]